MSIKAVLLGIIDDLVWRKETLTEIIDDIIYGDMNKKLNERDMSEINKIKKDINVLYETIKYLDDNVRNMEEN